MVKIEYAVCPLCGRNRVLKSEKKGRIRWDYVDPLNAKILQVREQHPRVHGGKSEGFTLVEEESLTLAEMNGIDEYNDVVTGIKEQTILLVKTLISLGIMKREEI